MNDEHGHDKDEVRVDNSNGNDNGRKRKRESVDHYANAYKKIQFEAIPPEPQELQIAGLSYTVPSKSLPGTPLSQFAHSFRANFEESAAKDKDHKMELPCGPQQVIHKSSNGLCIITAGSLCNKLSPSDIQAIEFVVSTADACSAGERRKRQSKMLKKGKVNKKNQQNNNQQHINDDDTSTAPGVVTPETEIVRIILKNGTVVPVFACVWGSILELNSTMTTELLVQDPLMEGYLAIILPTGPFPPKKGETNDGAAMTIKKEETNDSAAIPVDSAN